MSSVKSKYKFSRLWIVVLLLSVATLALVATRWWWDSAALDSALESANYSETDAEIDKLKALIAQLEAIPPEHRIAQQNAALHHARQMLARFVYQRTLNVDGFNINEEPGRVVVNISSGLSERQKRTLLKRLNEMRKDRDRDITIEMELRWPLVRELAEACPECQIYGL